MTPFAEGNVAAALRDLGRCIEEIQRACKTPGPEAWKHVALAHGHAITAKAHLDDAMKLEDMAKEAAE